jgi:hypothetical protein
MSQEHTGCNMWYEKAPITTESFANIIGAVYQEYDGVWHTIAPPN